MAGLGSAAACSGVEAPVWQERASLWKTFVHGSDDGWTHELVVVPTGTGIMKMTGPDSRSSILLVHGVDERGLAVVASMRSDRPFSSIPSLVGLAVCNEDRREELRTVLLAGLGDVLDMQPEARYAMVAVSWKERARISSSRTDASMPWPEATERMIAMLDVIGPVHRLVPGILKPAVHGMLSSETGTPWEDEDGLTLSSEMAIEADLDDAIGRLRTMAACETARRTMQTGPGSLIRPGISGKD